MFNVNVEDLKRLPGRIKEFRKKWRALSRRIGKIQEHVEKEYTRRKPAIAKKTHRMLRIYALIVTLSIIPFILIFQYPFAPWGVTFLSVVLLSHVAYWFVFYRRWRSSRTVTRYPSHTFNITHLFILTLTEAIYGYVTTEAILAPYRELQDEKALGL